MSNTCPIEFEYPFRNGRRCCNEPVYYEDTACLLVVLNLKNVKK